MSRLNVVGVDVTFGRGAERTEAVSKATLTVPAGSVLGLVGESGSGKSTLARAIVGLVPLANGSVLLDDGDIRRTGHGPCPVQMVFQDPASSLNPRMSVGDSVGEPLVGRLSRQARAARVAELLALVGIDPARGAQRPRAFSGGQKQRIALARALAAEPSVVIADEITSALDVSVQGSVLNVVREVQRKLGFSMLFISHDFAVVRYVSDAIGVMYQGRIVELAPTEELVGAPQHPYTQALLASVPRLGSRTVSAPPTPDDLQQIPNPGVGAPGCGFAGRCSLRAELGSAASTCLEEDPRTGAGQRLHQASCHFVGEAVG